MLLPLIIIPTLSALGSLFFSRSTEVSATIWIESSPLLVASDNLRSYQQPNEIAAGSLNEWIGTKSFVRELIQRTGLEEEIVEGRWPNPPMIQEGLSKLPVVGTITGDLMAKRTSNTEALLDQAVEEIRKSLRAGTVGSHLVRITYKGEDSQQGEKLVAGAITLFSERSTGRKAEQAKSAIEFYQVQLKEREQQLEASAQALRRFKEEHPIEPNSIRPPAQEQQLSELDRRYSLDRSLYEAALSRVEQTRLTGAADLQKAQSGFTVADPPEAPKSADFDKKKMMMFTLVGLVVGLSLGLGTVIVMTWASRMVLSGEDCVGVTDIPILLTIPHLVAPSARVSETVTRERFVRQFVGDIVAGNIERS